MTDRDAAPRLGGGAQAAPSFESLAYDVNSDTLCLFSGPCCSLLPTAFRLTRKNGAL